jgi:HK97 family phage major capsid protein
LTGATAYWVGENAAITPSDLTVGQLSLAPKKVAALVKMSNDLALLSNPSAEAMVRRDIALALGLAVDLAGLRGAGSPNVPLGIANTPSIATYDIGDAGGVFTWDHASAMEGKLEDANALRGTLGYVFSPKVKRLLKRQKVAQFSGDAGGSYIVLPTVSDAMLRDLLGYDFGTTTQIPVNISKSTSADCSEVYFANWNELLIGMWQGLEIAASNVAGDASGGAFSSDQLWIRAIQRVDIGLRHAASFCLCSDARVIGA